jgi:hypothetical protein
MMFPKFSPGMSLSPYGGSLGGSPQPFQFPGGQGRPLPFDPRGGGMTKPGSGMPGMPGMQPPGMPPPGFSDPRAQMMQQQAMQQPRQLSETAQMGMPQAQSQFGNYQQQAQLQPQAMGQQQMSMPAQQQSPFGAASNFMNPAQRAAAQQQQLGAPQPRATFNPPPFAELGLGGMSIGKGRQPTLDGIGGLGGAMRGFPGRAMF